MSPPAILVEQLTRTFSVKMKSNKQGLARLWARADYQEFIAVQDLSFSIASGDKVAFIGPNGAGKSTTLKMLCGLLAPSSGTARVNGYVPWQDTQSLARHIGLVFGQRSHLWQALPVQDSFDLLAKIYDIPAPRYVSQLKKLTDVFDLAPLLKQTARTLSLGQRMRCDLAAALLHQPSILFLDEPTIGLDVTAKALLRDHLNKLAHEFETTILLTSHDMDDIERICERVVLIDHGHKVLDTDLPSLKRDYTQHKVVSLAITGESPAYQHDGVRVIEHSLHRLVLDVDSRMTTLEAVVAECLATYSIQDITIESVPLEDVIRSIYANQQQVAS